MVILVKGCYLSFDFLLLWIPLFEENGLGLKRLFLTSLFSCLFCSLNFNDVTSNISPLMPSKLDIYFSATPSVKTLLASTTPHIFWWAKIKKLLQVSGTPSKMNKIVSELTLLTWMERCSYFNRRNIWDYYCSADVHDISFHCFPKFGVT